MFEKIHLGLKGVVSGVEVASVAELESYLFVPHTCRCTEHHRPGCTHQYY